MHEGRGLLTFRGRGSVRASLMKFQENAADAPLAKGEGVREGRGL